MGGYFVSEGLDVLVVVVEGELESVHFEEQLVELVILDEEDEAEYDGLVEQVVVRIDQCPLVPDLGPDPLDTLLLHHQVIEHFDQLGVLVELVVLDLVLQEHEHLVDLLFSQTVLVVVEVQAEYLDVRLLEGSDLLATLDVVVERAGYILLLLY